MKFKVVHPFILDSKTYYKGDLVEESAFVGNESIKANFLKTGFLIAETAKMPKAAPAPVTKSTPIDFEPQHRHINVPQALEIKTQADLVKAVEGPKPEAQKPVEAAKAEVAPPVPVQAPTKQRGRVSRQ